MRAVGWGRGPSKVVYVLLAAVAPAAFALACGSAPGAGSDETPAPGETQAGTLPVVAQFEGGYDGTNFWYRQMDVTAEGSGAGGSSGDIGTARQAVESNQANAFYTAPGGAGGAPAQTNTILIEQKEFHDETSWPTATCGATPAHGSCVRWRLFNAFPDQDLFRGYFYLTSLSKPTNCGVGCNITVQIPAPGPATQTSTPDLGLLGVTPAAGNGATPGLWRYGLLERSGPETRGMERWLAFTGTGTNPVTGKWGFHWVGQVRGALVKPTVRGSLKDGTYDKAPFYNANGTPGGTLTASTGIQSTPDGRYTTFSASGAFSSAVVSAGYNVFRYDTTNGAIAAVNLKPGGTIVPANCVAMNPSISADGMRIVFQSSGCDLGFGTTARQIYLRDLSGAGTTTLVSHVVGAPSTPGNSDSQSARMAAGGAYLTYISSSGNVCSTRPAGRSTAAFDVYRYNVATNTTERANTPTSGAGNWPSYSQYSPDISADGSRIVFYTASVLMVPGDLGVNNDVFLYDFGGAGISRLSVKQNGAALPGSYCYLPSISGDGASAAFICSTGGSDAFVATPTATAGRLHAYRRTIASAASLTMLDAAPGGLVEGSVAAAAVPPSLNGDGQLVAYLSAAPNLLRTSACNTPTAACQAVPSFPQAFVRDMGSPDPEVQRSFLASQIRSRLTTAVLPYAGAQNGINNSYNARSVQVIGTRDAAFAVYLGSGGGSADWVPDPSSGGWMVYLSPFSDALFQ